MDWMDWNGMHGIEWNGMEWNGMERNEGKEWNEGTNERMNE